MLAPAVTLSTDEQSWPTPWAPIRERLKTENKSLYAVLHDARPMERRETTLVIGLPSDFTVQCARKIGGEAHLSRLLEDVCGQHLDIEFVSDERVSPLPLPAEVERPEIIEAAPVVASSTEDTGAPDVAQVRSTTTSMETHLLRLPIWSPSRSKLDASNEWRLVGSLYHENVYVLEPLGSLVVRDLLVLIHIIEGYRENGQYVPISLGAAALAAGHRTKGGRQRQWIEESLTRMKATVFRHCYRFKDEFRGRVEWSILDRTSTTTLGGGLGVVKVSDDLVRFIENDRFTLLDKQCLQALVGRNDCAARWWLFLEGESKLAGGRDYLLYSAPEGCPPELRDTPAVTDLLRMHRQRRRDARRDVEKAAGVICDVDSAYDIQVMDAVGRNTYKARVTRDDRKQDRYSGTRGVGTGGRAGWVLGDAQVGTGGRASPPDLASKMALSQDLPSLIPSLTTVGYIPTDSQRSSSYNDSNHSPLTTSSSGSLENHFCGGVEMVGTGGDEDSAAPRDDHPGRGLADVARQIIEECVTGSDKARPGGWS
jgi:hypothetical protein